MKNTAIPLIAVCTLLCSLFAINPLQAQRITNLTANTPEKQAGIPNNTPVKPDLAAGQQLPSFEGLEEYVATHLFYPELAQRNRLEGTVKVLLSISPEGDVLEAQLLESIGLGCDEATLQMVRNMPRWAPARNYGIPVKGKKILDIVFYMR